MTDFNFVPKCSKLAIGKGPNLVYMLNLVLLASSRAAPS